MLLKECEVDLLSLDYDLGWGQPNGMRVAMHIVASGVYPRRIYLHTSSDGGRQSMFQTLYASKPDHVLLMAGPIPSDILMDIASSESAQE
jgi:hypothetical protein